jgi:hypothetical protein
VWPWPPTVTAAAGGDSDGSRVCVRACRRPPGSGAGRQRDKHAPLWQKRLLGRTWAAPAPAPAAAALGQGHRRPKLSHQQQLLLPAQPQAPPMARGHQVRVRGLPTADENVTPARLLN